MRPRGVREACAQALTATSGPIPYLSHGIGVDQSLFQGEQQSLGLTGDSPITRVVGQEPAGLTGDSPRTRGQVFQANATFASNGDTDVDWTWVGFGAGMAALLAAAMGSSLPLGAESRPSRTPVATVRSRERNGAGRGTAPFRWSGAQSASAPRAVGRRWGSALRGSTRDRLCALPSALDLEVSTSRS